MKKINKNTSNSSPLTPHCLAFDPGRDKTGFALVDFDGELIFSGIFPSSERKKFFDALLNAKNLGEFIIENPGSFSNFSDLISQIKFIAIGNGTHSKEFQKAASVLPFEIKIVDERNTTLEARNLYWKLHKPDFFTRLLPKGLRVPPRVLDDLAAFAIALKAISN
ncbi:MAG: endonuclease [Synergistaceae bacterium]|nr:endonuclease [Synergistaceae bacterium]